MLRYAIDQGVNYLHLEHFYDKKRQENRCRVINQALQDGYRDRIKLAINLPSLTINSTLDCERYLNEQLTQLQVRSIDFFLFGGLDRTNWPRLQELDVFRWSEGAMADGRVDKLGFSFHDQFQFLRDIVDAYDNWFSARFCTILWT